MYVKTERSPILPPPVLESGMIAWMHKNLFSSVLNTLLTLCGFWLLWKTVPPLISWAIINASWLGDGRSACAGLPGDSIGACWIFIKVRLGLLFYGFYPEMERWRVNMAGIMLFANLLPLLLTSLLPHDNARRWWLALFPITGTACIAMLCGLRPGMLAGIFLVAPFLLSRVDFSALARVKASFITRMLLLAGLFFGMRILGQSLALGTENSIGLFAVAAVLLMVSMRKASVTKWQLALLVLIFPFVAFWLLLGNAFGLHHVPTDQWGGMSLTLIIATFGMSTSLPLGILLALGRRSEMPVIRAVSIAYIEFIRGVPLISVLFMASVMLPLTLPDGVSFDKLLRALVGISIFYAAYMAEVVRGGMQALPKGQFEAAEALGFRYWRAMRLIIMPQALRIVIPGITNTFLGLFKDTTLVAVINLMDILGVIKSALADAEWLGFTKEGYLFAGFAFWIFCFGISRYAMQLEKRLKIKR